MFTTHPFLVGYIYSNFNSSIYDQYKIGLVFTLFWAFSIAFVISRFYTEVSRWNDILRKNVFPIKLVDNCIKTFLNKKFLHTTYVALTVEKKQLLIVLPCLGILSLALRTSLQNSIDKNSKIKVISKSATHLSIFFSILGHS